MSTVFRVPHGRRDDAHVKRLRTRAFRVRAAENSVGSRSASRVLASGILFQIASVEVSVPLLVPLALFIVDMIHVVPGIRSRWRGSALRACGAFALGGRASNGLGVSEEAEHWTLRWATFLATSRETSSKRQLRPAFANPRAAATGRSSGKVVRFGNELAAFRQLVGGRSHFADVRQLAWRPAVPDARRAPGRPWNQACRCQ